MAVFSSPKVVIVPRDYLTFLSVSIYICKMGMHSPPRVSWETDELMCGDGHPSPRNTSTGQAFGTGWLSQWVFSSQQLHLERLENSELQILEEITAWAWSFKKKVRWSWSQNWAACGTGRERCLRDGKCWGDGGGERAIPQPSHCFGTFSLRSV